MIKPKLIHPINVYFVKKVIAKDGTKDFDDDFHTRRRSKKLEWDLDNMIVMRGQLRNERSGMLTKTRGGTNWVTITKMNFWIKSEDILDGNGGLTIKRSDRIVRLEDLLGTTKIDVDLTVEEVFYRAPYEKFEFIQLVAKNQSPGVN